MVIIASINFIMVIITSSSELIMVIITSRFTTTCTRAWRRRQGWAPSSRTGRQSQSESTGSAPWQVRSGKQQLCTFWHLFQNVSAETTHCWGWVNLGEQKDDICNVLQTSVGHEEEDQAWVGGEMTLIWNFKMKNINNQKYQLEITTNYLEATNTSPIPLWGNFVSKRLGKWKYLKHEGNWSIDQKTKRQPTLAYFAYSDRRSLWRSRMMLGVILSEPRNMKKRPSRMFRLRITKPWPILQSTVLLDLKNKLRKW